MKYITKLLDCIQRCLIPKLSKNYEESTNHVEFDIRNDSLDQNFEPLMQCLIDLTLINHKEASTIISSLYILFKELKCNSPWNNDKALEYSKKLNFYFEVLGNVPLEKVLHKESTFDIQEIFDKCVDILHSKLTSEDFKKYPGLLQVFCMLLADGAEHQLQMKPQQVFPVFLLLIDDYTLNNKKRGLLGCLLTLRCMKPQDFADGNYYEVIYRSLTKTYSEKHINITETNHACLRELCRIFPNDVKLFKLDCMYSDVLCEIISESRLQRKAQCLKFARFIIKTHGVNCADRNEFLKIICDCLEQCTNDTVADVILLDTLVCLDEWVLQCWCVWQLSSDYQVISTLLKVLYTCKPQFAGLIKRLIVIFISLNKESDRKQLLANLEKAYTIDNDNFKQQIDEIKHVFSNIKFSEKK